MRGRKDSALVIIAALALLSLAAGTAIAATVTQEITYQGKLTDAAGNPRTGTYTVVFSLYEAATGGTALASSTQTITCTNGLFTTPVAFDKKYFDGRALFLGIKAGTDPEMTPRQEIRPVPYALGLRPGVVGASFTTSQAGTSWPGIPGMNVSTLFDHNTGVLINTSGFDSDGVVAVTSGGSSQGVVALTSGYFSQGIDTKTLGDYSDGVTAMTYGDYSDGVTATTYGDNSEGMFAVTGGINSDGVYARTYGDHSEGVYAYTSGTNSPGIYAESTRDVGVYGKGATRGVFGESTNGPGVYGIGKEGGNFTTNAGGSGLADLPPAVNVSTKYSYNPGIRVNTIGFGSNGVSAVTSGYNSYGVYASTSGVASGGVHAGASGDYSDGVYASTSGDNSNGVRVFTSGDHSNGMYASTSGRNSYGMYAITSGVASDAIIAHTSGGNSRGVDASTYGVNSAGVYAYTGGTNSPGIYAESKWDVGVYGKGKKGGYFTTNQGGTDWWTDRRPAINVSTVFQYNPGIYVDTLTLNSPGVYSTTHGDNSQGVATMTYGSGSPGFNAVTLGPNSRGVDVLSVQSYGVYADTGRSDQKYGIYTPDYLYAKGTQVPAADVAEFMPVAGDAAPGTVLVIGKGGILQPSAEEYDTHVAGIVSTAPGVSLGTKESGNPGEALIAVAGRVPYKVDASYGAIVEGDLLTTSDTPGHARKATNPKIGTVLGKAMGSLESGTGTIEVLVTLQ